MHIGFKYLCFVLCLVIEKKKTGKMSEKTKGYGITKIGFVVQEWICFAGICEMIVYRLKCIKLWHKT